MPSRRAIATPGRPPPVRDLQDMGLIDCRIGHDLDGEERRTEIELKPAPQVDPQELAAAAATLARWQNRYGPALNTGSRTGIRNAASHGRPLTASERQRRGCHHARQAAAARRSRSSRSNSPPPSGASAALRKGSLSDNPKPLSDPSGSSRTGVTRTRANTPVPRAAHEATDRARTADTEEGAPVNERHPGPQGAVGGQRAAAAEVAWDPEAADRQGQGETGRTRAADRPIARQAHARAVEVAAWTLEREWPPGRLREAWVVARYGATTAADSGPAAAGPLERERYVQLRRAVARWERNSQARPEGWPAGGLAALLHIGTLAAAGEILDPPRLLPYAIGRLDQLSKRLRATTPPPARSASTAPRPAPAAAANPPPRRASNTGPRGPRGFFCQDTPSPPSTSAAGSRSTSGTPRPAGSRWPMAIPTGSRFATRICSPAGPCRLRRTGARSCRCATEGRSSMPASRCRPRSKRSSCASSPTAPANPCGCARPLPRPPRRVAR